MNIDGPILILKCICGIYYYYEGNVERYLQTYDDKIKFYRFKDKK